MSVEDVGSTSALGPELPRRPATVPSEAEWSARTAEWEATPRDAEGRAHGLVRAWRQDGTLASEHEYRAGEREGAFRRFHPDGSLARAGDYLAGAQHGPLIAYGYDGPGATSEPLQVCCVPPGAWQLRQKFEHGQLSDVRWFDRAGVHILPSGKPHPARPDGVPPGAPYEERRDQWVLSTFADGLPDGVWRRWSREGVLRERDEYRAGKAHGLWQRFDAAGALVDETHWVDGRRGGTCRRVGVPAELYEDARVHEERGAFDRDQAVGAWTLLDDAAQILHTRALGAALDAEALLASPALAATPPSSWRETAASLEAEGRIAEALLATARGAVAAGDAGALSAALRRLAMPLAAASARATAVELVKSADGRLDLLANGLPAGADATSVLRALASSISGRDRVALELVDAALLLAPDRDDCHVTRALLYIYLGRPEDARAEAALLPPELEEQRTFIEGYARVIFPAFAFAPDADEIHTQFPDVPEGPEQPLENVRAQLQRYATRLGAVRAAVRARLPREASPSWLPPDVSRLLPDGPVELTSWEFEEIIEDEDAPLDAPPPEAKLVTVDERVEIDDAMSLPTLMRCARRDWVGLCWMCWAVGLPRVDLPEEIAAPAAFGAAAGMSIERLWRCRDRLITGGLRAMTQGVPGFQWEGFEIDLVPSALAEIAADEFREMRAVFYWLCDEGVQSPWQSNVRLPD
ncbi:MAG TPA: hypothetical protein VH560_05100 [Polyangia bacterium]|nr:hypothetical protein [Polyangia bacterium]